MGTFRVIGGVLAYWALLACACTSTQAPQRGAIQKAQILPLAPERPRCRYEPPSAPLPALRAHTLLLEIRDGRMPVRSDLDEVPVLVQSTGSRALEVTLHRDVKSEIQARISKLAQGDGPDLTVVLDVQSMNAWSSTSKGELHAVFEVSLALPDGSTLARGRGRASRQIEGPPYDAQELDDLHRGVGLEAFDAAFNSALLGAADQALQGQADGGFKVERSGDTVSIARASQPCPWLEYSVEWHGLRYRSDRVGCERVPLAQGLSIAAQLMSRLQQVLGASFSPRSFGLNDYPELYERVARAAVRSRDWDKQRGRPRAAKSVNALVVELAADPTFSAEVAVLLAPLGLAPRVSNVEKVFVGAVHETPFAAVLQAAGLSEKDRVPYASIVWFELSAL